MPGDAGEDRAADTWLHLSARWLVLIPDALMVYSIQAELLSGVLETSGGFLHFMK